MKKVFVAFTALTLVTSSCAPRYGQNQYSSSEAGRASNVEYARVVSVKKVKIQDKSTGIGATTGAAAGMAAGSTVGSGDGKVAAVLVGLVIGAIAGSMAENEMQNGQGYQYIVVTRAKKTKTIVQYQNEEDVVFRKGDRVLIQTQGEYQRLIATDDLPDTIKKPKEIKVID